MEALVKAKGGSLADWKRRSKRTVDGDVVRTFANERTGEMVEVAEKYGEIMFGPGSGLRTFTVKTTHEQLAGIVAHAWSKTEQFDGVPERGKGAESFLEETSFDGGKGLTPTVLGDLEVVRFDMENREWQKDEAYEGFEAVTGFNTTPGGLTYLGSWRAGTGKRRCSTSCTGTAGSSGATSPRRAIRSIPTPRRRTGASTR